VFDFFLINLGRESFSSGKWLFWGGGESLRARLAIYVLLVIFEVYSFTRGGLGSFPLVGETY